MGEEPFFYGCSLASSCRQPHGNGRLTCNGMHRRRHEGIAFLVQWKINVCKLEGRPEPRTQLRESRLIVKESLTAGWTLKIVKLHEDDCIACYEPRLLTT